MCFAVYFSLLISVSLFLNIFINLHHFHKYTCITSVDLQGAIASQRSGLPATQCKYPLLASL